MAHLHLLQEPVLTYEDELFASDEEGFVALQTVKVKMLRDEDPIFISTQEVAKRAGVTYRQLDYWLRKGWVEPADPSGGTGDPRLWYVWQVGEIAEFAERRKAHG